MAITSSLGFPNMFNISTNTVNVYEDLQSVTNRTRLLILTAPTELYNSDNFGVGLKKYLWQYNNINTRATIQDEIVRQLDLHEPCVVANQTVFTDGLKYTGEQSQASIISGDELNMTVAVTTTFNSVASVDLNSTPSTKQV